MQRASTTVVALVGPGARAALEMVEGAANVRVLHVEGTTALDRAVAASGEAARAHIPYLVHDADPFAPVADAWARYFDGAGPIGELEVVVADTLARARTGALELPDYYLMLDPEPLDATRRHFWLGLLHRNAPARVVPVEANADSLLTTLGALRPGRWWPPIDDLLAGVEHELPDQVGAPSSDS
jgi:hypothetical protein